MDIGLIDKKSLKTTSAISKFSLLWVSQEVDVLKLAIELFRSSMWSTTLYLQKVTWREYSKTWQAQSS